MASVEPFRKLVKLVARAFYDDEVPHKGANPGKSNKAENKGISIIVLDALTRRQWVKEEELAKSLKLHPKQLRRTLRVLEAEMLVVREDRKETVKGTKAYNAAVAATTYNPFDDKDKTKTLLHSYCCLDYAQVCDVVRYRIHRVKKMIKDELEDKNTVQEYVCPEASCGRRYSALDASRLISPIDMNFHCERCDAELVAENDKLAPKEVAGGDTEENARRRQREKVKDMLGRMEIQLKPLLDQLAKLKDLRPPDYGSFQQWQERALLQARPGNDGGDKSSGDRSMPMPMEGETKVEVEIGTEADAKQAKKEEPGSSMKVLPPWMIREGMKLNAQQRGEVKKEENGVPDQKPGAIRLDEKNIKPENAEKELQDEYAKAFYAAYIQQQQGEAQQDEEAPDERQIGEKSKRGGDEDEIDWEEEPAAPDEAGGELAAAPEQEAEPDDDIDWE